MIQLVSQKQPIIIINYQNSPDSTHLKGETYKVDIFVILGPNLDFQEPNFGGIQKDTTWNFQFLP